MKYLVKIIKEEEILPYANKASSKILSYATYLSEHPHRKLTKKFCGELVMESTELEEFLDDHGARNNKTWVYFGEIVASIRNFASTAYVIRHVISRIKFYELNEKSVKSFLKAANKRLEFLDMSLLSLFAHLREEGITLGLKMPQPKFDEDNFEDSMVVEILPQNINDENSGNVQNSISNVAKVFQQAFNN